MKKEMKPEFVLNQRELNLIFKCLRYCWHRYFKHSNSGIRKAIDGMDLEALIKDIEKLKS